MYAVDDGSQAVCIDAIGEKTMEHYLNGAYYEADEQTFSDRAYKEKDSPGVAWHILGWELVPDWETGEYERTGWIIAVMVGDDYPYKFEPGELVPLQEGEYCPECGQIGCTAYV